MKISGNRDIFETVFNIENRRILPMPWYSHINVYVEPINIGYVAIMAVLYCLNVPTLHIKTNIINVDIVNRIVLAITVAQKILLRLILSLPTTAIFLVALRLKPKSTMSTMYWITDSEKPICPYP